MSEDNGTNERDGWVQFGPHEWQLIHPQQASAMLQKLNSTDAGRKKFGNILAATTAGPGADRGAR